MPEIHIPEIDFVRSQYYGVTENNSTENLTEKTNAKKAQTEEKN